MKTHQIVGWSAVALLSASCSGSSSPTAPDASIHPDASDASHPKDAHTADAKTDSHPKKPDASTGPALNAGEICVGGTPTIRFDPPTVVVAAGKTRPVVAIVEPDLCSPTTMSFKTSDGSVTSAPASGELDIRHPTYTFNVTGGALGGSKTATATLTATIPGPDSGPGGRATLPVTVNDGAIPTCSTSDGSSATLSSASPSLSGTGGLTTASFAVPPGFCDVSADAGLENSPACSKNSECASNHCITAFTRTDELSLPSFKGAVVCANDDLTKTKAAQGSTGAKGHAAAPGALVPIGPAVTFTGASPIDMTQSLRRELNFALPINPAAIPTEGRLRHIQVLFMSPGSQGVRANPEVITIADPQITQVSPGSFVFQFASPWLGTYQAAFSPDAGTVKRTRHVTHRAVLGFSMGGGGAASFGFRHHDQFDMIGPLGGPSDWTWLLWYIEQYYLGGFCPETLENGAKNPAYPNCPTYAPNLYPFHETFAHTCDYDHWFFQEGGGTGGHFSRSTFAQLFDDLALMHGNPNGQNFDPNAAHPNSALSFFPAGPQASDPWVAGNSTGLPGTCAVATNPLSPDPDPNDPPYSVQQTWQDQCTTSRCDPASVWTAKTGYFDARYNPKGTLPVISYCESGLQTSADSPYEDLWTAPQPGNDFPIDVALSVDLNGNGLRDLGEPVLRQGHEPWSDVGVDGLADVDEPGYDAALNPDPNQDDYDFQLNPSGTEGDHRYEMGEPFLDYGLDGVKDTPQLKAGGYDWGEGDGVFSMATGLASFYAADAHSIVRQWSRDIPGGPMTDDALLRLSIWADGGVRDMVNFGAVANHLVGSIASRKVAAGKTDSGTQLRTTAFYDGFDRLPGQTPGEQNFDVNAVRWSEVVDAAHVRYGSVDASPLMIEEGDGQHVGTATQLLDRLQTSIYYAEQQWPDADRTLTDVTLPTGDAGSLVNACSGGGLCTFPFQSNNRQGPVYVTLPPGYAQEANIQRNVRYPVIYALHGYGQTPDGLAASALVSTAFMNDASRSEATRLGKAILVYVDGRCRFSSDSPPQPECVEGSFYLDSDRPDNAHPGTKVAQFDAWFDALVDYIDANFRTMPASDIEVTQ